MQKKYIDTETGTINLLTDEVYEGLPESAKKTKQLYEAKTPKIITEKFENENSNSDQSTQSGESGNDGGTVEGSGTSGIPSTGNGSTGTETSSENVGSNVQRRGRKSGNGKSKKQAVK